MPNKEFITGQLMNWTLSDTVAAPRSSPSGSPTARTRDWRSELLLEVAPENELVLERPAPAAFFRGFGDSSLDFELRVFIPDMRAAACASSTSCTWTIDHAFREAGIEIAFPQRDLHVRHSDASLPVHLSRERAEDAPDA